MTFLPIVARELRAAARRNGTYWTRLGVALGAIFVGTSVFVLTLGIPAQKVGQYIFQCLSGLALLYCLAYGRRATADCLSSEKREGTLGLLFLTDLKGHDVVLGKLAATSLAGFYGLLAFFPVLAVPLLLGGITSGEFWRMVLLLADTFLFSLAIGMAGSALSREYRHAMAANFFLVLVLMALPPAVASLISFFSPTYTVSRGLFSSCPLFAFFFGLDAQYKLNWKFFWWSIAVIHALTWALLLLASWVAPRSWQDRPARSGKSRWRGWWQNWSYGQPAKQRAFRREALGVNAFYWLAARARLKPMQVWVFLGAMAGWWIVAGLAAGSVWLDEVAFVITALLLSTTLKWWLAIEACQQLAEDRRTGTLELLLSTPLSVSDITQGQLLALRRQFLKPLLTVLGVEFIMMAGLYWHARQIQTPAFWIGGMLMLVADMLALAWVAMWKGMTTRSQHRAVVSTALRVLILPWAVLGFLLAMVNLWAWIGMGQGNQWEPGWKLGLGLWLALGLAADIGFGLWARRQLRRHFRQFALQRFAPVASPMSRWLRRPPSSTAPATSRSGERASITSAAQPKPKRGIHRRRAALTAAILLLLFGAALAFRRSRPTFPTPTVVSLSQSKTPLRVFAGAGAVLLILPDGSLWRWGQTVGGKSPMASVPERIGMDNDWKEAAPRNSGWVGLRRDGSLWTWSLAKNYPPPTPQQVGSDRGWASVAAVGVYTVARREDGTLWAWGDNTMNQLGNGPGPNQLLPTQVGTNADWAQVHCTYGGATALRLDGTLWAWGQFHTWSGIGGFTPNRVPFPTRVCLETNWTDLSGAFGSSVLARNRAGEVWDPICAPPNPLAPVGAVGRLVLSNAVSGRFVLADCMGSHMYQVRDDGTLWERMYPFAPQAAGPLDPWRRVGKRSDWISLWGGDGTALGLTADGTLWTWGIDPSRERVLDFITRLKLMQSQVAAWIGGNRSFTRYVGYPQYQKDPRPLLLLRSSRPNSE